MDEGKYDEAATAYKGVLQSNKSNAEAKAGIEEVQRAKAAEREIAVRQQSIRPGIEHAKLLMDQGKYDEAADAYKRVLQTNNANAEAKAGLEQVQRARAAEREIANGRSTPSNSQPPTLAHAKQLMDDGKYDEATETYKQILRNDKNNARAKAGLEKVQRAQAAEHQIASIRSSPTERSDLPHRDPNPAYSSAAGEVNNGAGRAKMFDGYAYCFASKLLPKFRDSDRNLYTVVLTRSFGTQCKEPVDANWGVANNSDCAGNLDKLFAQAIPARFGLDEEQEARTQNCHLFQSMQEAENQFQQVKLNAGRNDYTVEVLDWTPSSGYSGPESDANATRPIAAPPPSETGPRMGYFYCTVTYYSADRAIHLLVTDVSGPLAASTNVWNKCKDWAENSIYKYSMCSCSYDDSKAKAESNRQRAIDNRYEPIHWSPE